MNIQNVLHAPIATFNEFGEEIIKYSWEKASADSSLPPFNGNELHVESSIPVALVQNHLMVNPSESQSSSSSSSSRRSLNPPLKTKIINKLNINDKSKSIVKKGVLIEHSKLVKEIFDSTISGKSFKNGTARYIDSRLIYSQDTNTDKITRVSSYLSIRGSLNEKGTHSTIPIKEIANSKLEGVAEGLKKIQDIVESDRNVFLQKNVQTGTNTELP